MPVEISKQLLTFEKDKNLHQAFAAYFELFKVFKQQYKRDPKCSVYVGSLRYDTSAITAYSDNTTEQNDDMNKLAELCN